jgi:hypothetical protein
MDKINFDRDLAEQLQDPAFAARSQPCPVLAAWV